MSFNSIKFLAFFPVVAAVFFLIPHRMRWAWLLLSSYYFYMSWNPKYALLIAVTTLSTYLSGILIEKADEIENREMSIELKKFWVFLSFLINLGILFLFKYYNFFIVNLTGFLARFNIWLQVPYMNYMLPVGISFYTFQALSYTVDVYRKDAKAERHLGKYALFVSFFPQLLSGPIQKSKDFLPQLKEKHTFDYERSKNGLLLMMWGYFQKLVVADRLALLVNTVYNSPADYKGFEIIVATLFFAFQIYCDFASYSNIARGAAEVMGFKLSINFKQPYFSKSIKEFWRRWHISLGDWFKDYLYIPLGGNRRGKARQYFNVMVVFLLSGLWHGAAVNFIIWGGLHGFYQIAGYVLKPIKERIIKAFDIKKEVFSFRLFQSFMTFVLVSFAWIFFRANTFTDSRIIISNMLYFNPWIFKEGTIFNLGLDQKDFLVAIIGILLVLAIDAINISKDIRHQFSLQNTAFRWAVYLTGLMSILIFGLYGPGYNTEQFIYFQF